MENNRPNLLEENATTKEHIGPKLASEKELNTCLHQFVDSKAMEELEAIFTDSILVQPSTVEGGEKKQKTIENSNINSTVSLNHVSRINSNSSTSGYASGRSSPSNSNNLANLDEKISLKETQKPILDPINSLIDDLIILNNSNENEENDKSRLGFLNSFSDKNNDKDQNIEVDTNLNHANLSYLIRRKGSLEKCNPKESVLDNLNTVAPFGRVGRSQFPTYSNSTIYLNTIASKPNRHHRSNSIINASSYNPSLNFSSSNYDRDFDSSLNVYGNLKLSNKAHSSNSIQHDTSVNSLKSLGQIDSKQSKINFIKDLQIRLMDMQKECYFLRCELDTCQQKLSSNLQSIKQFWSPELRKERQMRKEEQQKFNIFLEKFKIVYAQNKNLIISFEEQIQYSQQLEKKLEQIQKEKFNQISPGNSKNCSKDKTLLKKTINELEMRINTQKQSLNTKDETIKKLFQIVKSLNSKHSANTELNNFKNNEILEQMDPMIQVTNEQHSLKEKLSEEEHKNYQLQQLVNELQQQKSNATSELNINTSSCQNISNLDSLPLYSYLDSNSAESNLLIEANKDGRIKQLELLIQKLQNDNMQRNFLNISDNLFPSSSSQFDILKNNEKIFKEKIEALKFDLARKDNELEQLKTKYETCESKEKDLQHYLTLLKESLATKEQQISMQQSECDELRNRLKERENFIEKKNQHIQQIQLEKHQRDSDIGELNDQMDIKERKINVLNRKIENLEEQLKDKETQIQTLRTKLCSNSMSFYQNNLMQNLELSLEQKDKLIEKLSNDVKNYSRNQSREIELTEQIETLNISLKELNDKIELKNKEIQDYQNEIFDLKDEVESCKTQLSRKDSHVNSLEMSLTHKNEEIEIIEEKFNRLQKQQFQMSCSNSNQSQQEIESTKKVIINLQKDLRSKELQIQQLTTELITLKELIDDFEEQKQVLKSKLEQQQIQFSQLESNFQLSTNEFELRLTQQKQNYEEQIQNLLANNLEQNKIAYNTNDDKKCNDEILLKKQIDDKNKEINIRDEQIHKLDQRINDLEEALRESVSITAQRELVFAQQRQKTDQIENDNKILMEEISSMEKNKNEQQLLFNRYQEELYIREEQLQKLEEEKVKEMNELLITKQEILLSTISEKDSAIAELECNRSSNNKAKIQRLIEEKDYLHHQLKNLNEQRMKLMNDYMQAKDSKDKVKILAINPIMAHDEDGIYA